MKKKNKKCIWLVFKVHIQPAGSYWSLGERHSCHTGSEEWECQTLAQFFRQAHRFTCAKTFHVLILMYIHGLCICYAYVWKFSHTKMHSPLLAKPFVRSTQSMGVVLLRNMSIYAWTREGSG